jgi:hypothetical protein
MIYNGCIRKSLENNECRKKHICSVCKGGRHPTCYITKKPAIMKAATAFKVKRNASSESHSVLISTEHKPSYDICLVGYPERHYLYS